MDVDPTLAGDREHAAGLEDGLDPAGRLEQVVLARPVRDGVAGPEHEPVATALAHVLLLRPEEEEPRPPRQDRHEHERVDPVRG